MHDERWQGSLWLANDFAILQGAAGATDSHAHYAQQLMLSTGAPFTVQLDGLVHTTQRLLVESLRPHAIVAAPASMLTIYAEPQRLSGAALQAVLGSVDGPRRPRSLPPCKRCPCPRCPMRACNGRWRKSTPYSPARSAPPPWPRRRICR